MLPSALFGAIQFKGHHFCLVLHLQSVLICEGSPLVQGAPYIVFDVPPLSLSWVKFGLNKGGMNLGRGDRNLSKKEVPLVMVGPKGHFQVGSITPIFSG